MTEPKKIENEASSEPSALSAGLATMADQLEVRRPLAWEVFRTGDPRRVGMPAVRFVGGESCLQCKAAANTTGDQKKVLWPTDSVRWLLLKARGVFAVMRKLVRSRESPVAVASVLFCGGP